MSSDKSDEIASLLMRMSKVVGHEVRNPLAVMKNSAHFVKAKLTAGGAELDPKVSKHLGFIEAEIARANEMIDDIVLLGRAQRLELAKADLHALLDDAINAFPAAQTAAVAREYAADKLVLAADAERLRIALHKLLANAIEATPSGGKIVVATTLTANRQALVKINDSGPGFNKESLDHLFEPFFSTKPRGLGLGLALARMIIVGHHGKIDVRNESGRGATVVVSLPARSD